MTFLLTAVRVHERLAASTNYLPCFMFTVAFLLDDLFTGFTRASMADFLTGMLATVELALAYIGASEHLYTTALYRMALFPAQTGTGDDRVTRGAGPRMAQYVTVVLAVCRAIFLAHLPTAMWCLHSVPLWVSHFSTKTPVLEGDLVSSVLTSWASPAMIQTLYFGCG